MRKTILGVFAAILAAWSAPTAAQTACKYISPNVVLTASQWNYCFQQKNDALGFTPLNAAGGVLTGKLITAPSSSTIAGFELPPGTAPLGPKDGDIWTTTAGLYAQINGTTVGPIGAGIPASASANQVFSGPATGAAAAPTFRSLVAADLPIATGSAVGATKPDGTTTTVSGAGAITASTATSSAIGISKPDNSTITISGGVLSAATATNAAKGIVQPDNSSITISSGTISAHLTAGYNQQTFTVGGGTTFTTPATSTTATVYHYRVVGGGGGGGGTNASTATGGGGGAGAYAEGTFTGVAANTAITVTVGALGTAGNNTGSNGGSGGNSSIGAPVNITCGGGGPGIGSTTTTGLGGAGGSITGTPNIMAVPGQRGQAGVQTNNGSATTNIIAGGTGGNSVFGFGGLGGQAIIGGSAQSAATGYGAGGAGGISSTATGSAGAPGIVIIDWIQ